MAFYWVVLILVFTTFSVIVLCGRYSVELKHQFDEEYKPSFILNEGEVLVSGALFGSLGLLISYIAFPEIRKDDAFNSRRFLWISLVLFAIHVTVIVLLSVFDIIVYDV